MRRIIVTMLLLCFFYSSNGQSGIINGTTISVDKQTISAVTIRIESINLETVSSNNGTFQFLNLPVGKHILLVSCIGYQTFEREVTVSENQIVQLNLVLTESNSELKEIMVTAEKREALVQKIPSSITVLGEKQLGETRTWSTTDLNGLVPNMFVLSDGAMYMYYQSRGISSYSYDPVIQTYIDDVPLFSTNSLNNQLFDINRMEVLRGPQGTLYGRNAIGGVVNIVSSKPADYLKGRGEISFGNYGQQRYNAAISTPLISKKLYLGLNGTFNTRGGYITNTNTNRKIEGNNTINGNIILRYIPNEKWSFNVTSRLDRFVGRGIGIASSFEEANQHPYTIHHTSDPVFTRTLLNASMVSKYIGRTVTLTSVSAINNQTLKTENDYDADYTPADAYSYTYEKYGRPDKERNYYQEFRVGSNAGNKSKFTWIAGAVYYKINVDRRYGSYTGIDSGDPDAPYLNVTEASENHAGFALFGQLTYPILPKLDLTVGLRYDDEQKNLTQHTEFVKEPDEPIISPSQKYKGNFNALSPKFSTVYKFSDKIMLYATYAKGFRSGGLNWGVTTPGYVTFGPEHSHNLELGNKATLLDNKLRINTAIFWLFYKDIQAYNYFGANAFEAGNVNAGSATSKGFEAEIIWLPFKGFQFEESFGFTDARYNNFNLYDFTTEDEINYKNKFTQYTPRTTNMMALQYAFPLNKKSKGIYMTLRAESRYLNKIYYSFDNLTTSPAYTLLNASIDVAFQNWDIKIWSRNLTNKMYFTSVYPWGGATFGTPRMYGTTLAFKF